MLVAGRAAMPLIEDAEVDGAVWCASDGVIDINALLSGRENERPPLPLGEGCG